MYNYKLINLNNLKNDSTESIKKFLRFNGVKKFDECDIESLKKLINKINSNNMKDFNVSYNVDKLDKEFDLVKMDEYTIIDIELKTSNKDLEQCIENYKLLQNEYDNRRVIVYCYESENNQIYLLEYESNTLVISSFDKLNSDLDKIKKGIKLNININVSSVYLIPDFYFQKKYNLSFSQNQIKNKIICSDKKINVIGGRAGCGKTLLALDLFDYFRNNYGKDVSYLAPFKYKDIINKELIDKLKIKSVKDFLSFNNYTDIIIVDEAQRLKKSDILLLANYANDKLIMFGDLYQNIDGEGGFEEMYNDKKSNAIYNMKQLIRTDDTFDIYARKILNLTTKGFKYKQIDKSKIEIVMFGESINDLSNYVFLAPSKSLYYYDCMNFCDNLNCANISKKCKNTKEPHTIVSLEYQNVVVYLCNGYSIRNNEIVAISKVCTGKLDSQLYTIITRATEHLIIVTDNITMYNFLMEKLEEM